MKNFLLLILFFIIVGYCYITINERQKQRLIRERRPRLQEMVNRYEFRRALYQIRETKERVKEEPQAQRPEETTQTQERPKEEVDEMERLKNEPSTPAQPIENVQAPDNRPVIDGSELRRSGSLRGAALPPATSGRYGGVVDQDTPNDNSQGAPAQQQPTENPDAVSLQQQLLLQQQQQGQQQQ